MYVYELRIIICYISIYTRCTYLCSSCSLINVILPVLAYFSSYTIIFNFLNPLAIITVSIESTTYDIIENQPVVEVCLVKSGPSSRDITVSLEIFETTGTGDGKLAYYAYVCTVCTQSNP